MDDKKRSKINEVPYDYHDAKGRLVYQSVRQEFDDGKKTFLQRKPNGNGGWDWTTKGVEPVPFMLPALLTAIKSKIPIFVVEGEKDVLNLKGIGVFATTNHGGAGKWRECHSKYFPAGTRVIILPDNDKPGFNHAENVAAQLTERGCIVKVVELPGLPDKGDVSDWLASGNTKDDFFKLVKAAAVWKPKGKEPDKPKKSLRVVCMADVEPEEISWLWEPYIPKGKLTLLIGDPGAGKTFLSLALAAAISTGNPLPDKNHGRPITRREPGNVIYMSAEDGIADTLRPRLDMLGGNPNNVHAITGTTENEKESAFSFDDLLLLDGLAEALKPELIICDPLHAFLGANIDMHRANETRPILSRLATLAEKHKCAVLCLEHMNKSSNSNALYRILGSIDFSAIARSILLAGNNPDNPGEKAITHIKSSLAPVGASQGYALEIGKGFYWTGLSELTTGKMLGNDKDQKKNTNSLDNAVEWLKEELASGPREGKAIEELAKSDGISAMTLRRAREQLKIEPYKEKGVKNGKWLWELPGLMSGAEQIEQVEQVQKLFNNGAGSTSCSTLKFEQVQ